MNQIERYLMSRARLDYAKQFEAPAIVINSCQKTLAKRTAELPSWLTQEVLDKLWTGRVRADYLNELIGSMLVCPIERCWTCVNWDDDEDSDGCKVYGEQLVVCDRYEERISV